MGIREAIEKLATKPFWDNYAQTHRQFLEKDDVLSILDNWELVTEEEAGKLIPVRLSDLLKKNIRPGDRIAVYVRRVK